MERYLNRLLILVEKLNSRSYFRLAEILLKAVYMVYPSNALPLDRLFLLALCQNNRQKQKQIINSLDSKQTKTFLPKLLLARQAIYYDEVNKAQDLMQEIIDLKLDDKDFYEHYSRVPYFGLDELETHRHFLTQYEHHSNKKRLAIHCGLNQLREGNFYRANSYLVPYRAIHKSFLSEDSKTELWTGQALPNDTLLLYREQGMGDEIQLMRCIPYLASKVRQLDILTRPACTPLYKQFDCISNVYENSTGLPEYKYAVGMFSAMYWCIQAGYIINSDIPYLIPDSVKQEQFSRYIEPDTGIKIGIQWQVNPNHPHRWYRNVDLSSLLRLLELPNVTLYSIQFTNGKKSLSENETSDRLIDLAPHIETLEDTTAIISLLDMVVVCDSVSAHIAGALNKPAWILRSKYSFSYYAGLHDTDSEWYPSMKVLRQRKLLHWDDLIEEVRNQIHRHLLEQMSPTSSSQQNHMKTRIQNG